MTEANLLYDRLRKFLEQHTKSKILASDAAILSMYIKMCHTNQNKKPKDQTINFLLLRFKEQALDQSPSYEQSIIGNFLIDEMEKFYGAKK
ncbi:MAG: hypothetical protein H3C43_05155 [Leptonema sp. (in: Bacteria)]|nr:hypothetical protein [Leptonema sp. (in: bacteria)]